MHAMHIIPAARTRRCTALLAGGRQQLIQAPRPRALGLLPNLLHKRLQLRLDLWAPPQLPRAPAAAQAPAPPRAQGPPSLRPRSCPRTPTVSPHEPGRYYYGGGGHCRREFAFLAARRLRPHTCREVPAVAEAYDGLQGRLAAPRLAVPSALASWGYQRAISVWVTRGTAG